MWALVKEKPEPGLWMRRVEIPQVGKNEVKIKILKTSICGTDVDVYKRQSSRLPNMIRQVIFK